MAKISHTHKFKKLRYKSGNEIFFCTLPDCNVKINPKLALGKRCICNRCGEEFIMGEYALRLVKPHCDKCHKSKGNDMKLDDIVNSIPESSLSERLQQMIQSKQTEEEEI